MIDRDETRLRTIEQLEEFLSACGPVAFTAAADDGDRHAHISRVLLRFDHPGRNKRERGVVLRYLQHTSGYGRAQGNRLALVPLAKRYGAPSLPFARKYTPADVALRVEMDKALEDVCGPAMACLLQRAYHDYDDARYERLAQLSVLHLHKARKSNGYQVLRTTFTKTHPPGNSIGVRKAPAPEGRAGFVRIDSVHQGDQDGRKRGLSHRLGGCGQPAAGRGLCRAHQRCLLLAGTGADHRPVPVCGGRLSLRQRFGNHQ